MSEEDLVLSDADWRNHIQEITIDFTKNKIRDEALSRIWKFKVASQAAIAHEKLDKGYKIASKIHELVGIIGGPSEKKAGELLKLAYEGVGHIASGNPVMEKFVAYHETHIKLLATSVTALNDHQSIIRMYDQYKTVANSIKDIVDKARNDYGYVYEMLDGDGVLPGNLPKNSAIRNYYYDDSLEYLNEASFENTGKPLNGEIQFRIAIQSESEEDRLRLASYVVKTYNEVAAIRAYIGHETSKFIDLTNKIRGKFDRMTKSGGFLSSPEDNINFMAAKSAESKLQADVVLNKNFNGDLMKLLHGDHLSTPNFITVGKSGRSMNSLTDKYKSWAKKAITGDNFLTSF